MWKPDVCIYHFPCDDGFGAAFVVWKKWGDDVEFKPCNYGQPVPDGLDGKNVLIADFSFKPDVLREIGEKARSVIILDHHKTAEADLVDFRFIPNPKAKHQEFPSVDETPACFRGTVASFDMERSGARMTWDFCFPGKPVPDFIRYLEDRDLWRMSLDGVRAFSLNLRSYPYEFKTWNTLFSVPIEHVVAGGREIERFYDRKIEEICQTATLKTIGEHEGVPVANCPYAFASDTAHELLKQHPAAPFAACYFDSYGGRTYSLRSEDGRVDVSEVARAHGGGGHRNAAGFRMPL